MQAEEQLQQLGRRHAAVLDALPVLESVWQSAATEDPLRDPAAAAKSKSHPWRRQDKGGSGGGGSGSGGGGEGGENGQGEVALSSLYRRAADALARPGGNTGMRPHAHAAGGRAAARARGRDGGSNEGGGLRGASEV